MRFVRIIALALTVIGGLGFAIMARAVLLKMPPECVGTRELENVYIRLQVKGAFIRGYDARGNIHLKAYKPFPSFRVTNRCTARTLQVRLTNVNPDAFEVTCSNGKVTSSEPGCVTIRINSGSHSYFKTKPVVRDDFTFFVFGDMQGGWRVMKEIAAEIKEKKPLFAVCLGDLVQNPKFIRYRLIERLMEDTHVPFYPIPGNHDRGHGNSMRLYNIYFGPERYCYRVGNVSFIAGVTKDMEVRSDELEWLAAKLKQASDHGGHIITLGHVPPYRPDIGTGTMLSPYYPDEADALHGLLKEYNVDVACFGHEHAYFRLTYNGVPYLISGGGGSRLRRHIVEGHGFGELKGKGLSGKYMKGSPFHYMEFSAGKTLSYKPHRLDFPRRRKLHMEHVWNLFQFAGYLSDEAPVTFVFFLMLTIGWATFWPVQFMFFGCKGGHLRFTLFTILGAVLTLISLTAILISLGRAF